MYNARMEFIYGRKGRALQILCGLGISLFLTGCVGYVQGPGPGGAVIVEEPDLFWFGGYGDGGHARDFGHRGYESRGWGRR